MKNKDFCQTVKSTIAKHQMIAPGQTVCAAVSGGPDSTALLYALLKLRDGLDCQVKVCHFDHAIRDESPDDALHVKQVAENLGIEFSIDRAEIPSGRKVSQEMARDLRYRFFEQLIGTGYADVIATGHTLDDSVETSIMWMLRGTGPSGFGGIPPVRGAYIRPMIELSKAELVQWLDDKSVKYITDPSNATDKYLRNAIRHSIVTTMERLAPGAVKSIARFSKLVKDQNAVLEAQAQAFIKAHAERYGDSVAFDPESLRKEPEAVRMVIYREGFRTVDLTPSSLTFTHLDAIEGLLEGGALGRQLDLPGGAMARLDHAGLTLGRRKEAFEFPEIAFECPLRIETVAGTLSVIPVDSITDDATLIDASKVPAGAVFRTRLAGDYLKLPNTQGRKSLKKYFIDRKVPSGIREQMPLLADGSEILWVPNLFLDSSIAVVGKADELAELRWG